MRGVQDTQRIAKVSALLDEIKEEAESLSKRSGYHAAIVIHTKATEAQNLLIGEPSTDSRDN